MEKLSNKPPPYRNPHYVTKNTAYDDVFGGPPRFGVVPSLSPRIEDYAEIFGGLRGASRVATSIPVLDLPPADLAGIPVSFSERHFDYSEVFGGFDGQDFAVTFEELMEQSKASGDCDSSDEAWTPAQSETLSDESEPFACTDRYESMPNAELHQSNDGIKQFKVSYNRVFHTNKDDVANGVAHVTQLNDVPGYSFLVNAPPPPQKMVVTNNLTHEDVVGGLGEGKRLRKTTSCDNKSFVTISDISLKTRPSHLPPPSRPPPDLDPEERDSNTQSSKIKASKSVAFGEITSADSSPLFYDVEVDATTSAAVSAAAMKDVMEKAQEKLKSAKHRKDRSKKVSERDLGGVKGFADNAREHGKGYGLLQESLSKIEGNVEWKQDEEFYEVVETDDNRNLFGMGDDQRVVLDNLRNDRDGQEVRENQGISQQEEVNRQMESDDEIHEKIIVEAVESEVLENMAEVRKKETKDEGRFEDNLRLEENEMRLRENVQMETTEIATNDYKLLETLEREENEKKEREACEGEEKEKREKEASERELKEKIVREAIEKEENEKRLRLVLEEKVKKLREAWEREEKEIRENKVCERDFEEKRLREAIEKEEKEKRSRLALEEKERKQREACEREENEEREKEARESEEKEMREKEALDREEKEKREKEACEREVEDKRIRKALEEKEKKQREACEREEREKREKESRKREIKEKIIREAIEQEENEKRLKIALEKEENEKQKLSREGNGVEKKLKDDLRRQNTEEEPNSTLRKEENKEKVKERCALEEDTQEVLLVHEREVNGKRPKEAFEHEDIDKMWEEDCRLDEKVAFCGTGNKLDKNSGEAKKTKAPFFVEDTTSIEAQVDGLNSSGVARDGLQDKKIETRVGESKESLPMHDTVFEFEKKPLKKTGSFAKPNVVSYDLVEGVANSKKVLVGKDKKVEKFTSSEEVKGKVQSQNAERKGKSLDDVLSREEKEREERMNRERKLENERLRKIEGEREREREREKDRMAVDMASLERATADARLAEARERLEKANAEARLRAERAAVERATAEARERAFQKAKAGKVSVDSRERVERMMQSSLQSDSCDGVGSTNGTMNAYSSVHGRVEVESAERCKARLERHQRTAQRAAKALEEKNMRDLVAHRELAERNRLAEGLDAEVKRWSSGKEGNLRALLSTLQYILGPDSGWKALHLTEVITSAAVKTAYRKATLCVHPDKLQQRGASIHQKYVCEKVFDLLKAAWNKFNSEER